MNITGVTRTQGVYPPAIAKSTERMSRSSENQDFIALSSKAKEYQVARNEMSNIPDIRRDRIQDISSRIDAGTYNVQARDIAEKIIRPMIS